MDGFPVEAGTSSSDSNVEGGENTHVAATEDRGLWRVNRPSPGDCVGEGSAERNYQHFNPVASVLVINATINLWSNIGQEREGKGATRQRWLGG